MAQGHPVPCRWLRGRQPRCSLHYGAGCRQPNPAGTPLAPRAPRRRVSHEPARSSGLYGGPIDCLTSFQPVHGFFPGGVQIGSWWRGHFKAHRSGVNQIAWVHAVMMDIWREAAAADTVGVGGLAAGYFGMVSGAVTVDVGVGPRCRPLGPIEVAIAAPARAGVRCAVRVVSRAANPGSRGEDQRADGVTDMVLAAHHTPLRRGLVATTVETLAFSRPDLIEFRLTRRPVPHVVEQFLLTDDGDATRLRYVGDFGTDGWAPGARWAIWAPALGTRRRGHLPRPDTSARATT